MLVELQREAKEYVLFKNGKKSGRGHFQTINNF
jgi:hypothetical protein